jgi:hypothetical protein
MEGDMWEWILFGVIIMTLSAALLIGAHTG